MSGLSEATDPKMPVLVHSWYSSVRMSLSRDRFVANLAYWMDDRGVNQKDVADALELTQGYVSMLVNGTRKPSAETLERLIQFFQIDPADLWIARNETVKRQSESDTGSSVGMPESPGSSRRKSSSREADLDGRAVPVGDRKQLDLIIGAFEAAGLSFTGTARSLRAYRPHRPVRRSRSRPPASGKKRA